MSIPPNPPLVSVSWSTLGEWVIGIPLRFAGLILLAIVLRWVLHRVIDKVVSRAVEAPTLAGKITKMAELSEASAASSRRSQRAQAIGCVCNPVIVLSEGRPLVEGPPDTVRRDPRVLGAYLGARHQQARPAP